MRSRGWCFTINNYDIEDMVFVSSLYEDDTNCTYLIMGFEEGRRKTPHIQGYVYYTEAKSFESMVKLHSTWHIEAQKAKKNVNAYVYCMEGNKFYEMGERPRQGHRTDLETIKFDIANDVSMKDISRNYFSQWCQYRRAFDEYKKLHVKYDTQIHVYDNSEDGLDYSMRYIFSNYDMSNCFLMRSEYDVYLNEIMVKYYSREYKYIIISSGKWPKCISENVTYVIEKDAK